jgi:ribonuclease Z
MTAEINELTAPACEGSGMPLTTTPVEGTPRRTYPRLLEPEAETLDADEIRVTVLGSGDPFVRPSQGLASVLIEVGKEQRDHGLTA